MVNLKGATKTGLILVSVLVAVLGVSLLVNYIQSVSMGEGFVVSNITAGGQTNLFAATNAGLNFTSFESGATNVTVNMSIKAFYGNVTRVNITVPGYFNLSSEFSNITSNTSNANQSNIMFRNFSYGASGITNITWTANSANDGNGPILNSSSTGYFSFRLNVPAGITIPTNNTINITVTLQDQVAGTANSTNITLYINDTTIPNNLRYIDTNAVAKNNSNTTNTSLDFMVAFNETNPAFVNFSIGWGNNKTITNRSMTIAAAKSALGQNATISIGGGIPDGKHNFTFFVTDVQNGQTLNSTTYYATVDTVAPSLTLTLPSSDVTKSAVVSSSDLTCSATDATAGLNSSDFTMSIDKPSGTTVQHTCGTDFKDTADVGEYKATFTREDVAGNTATKTGTFKVAYKQLTSSTTSASTPVTSPTVLASTTLTVTTPVTTAQPVALTVPTDVASKGGATKITIEVSKDVSAADATVAVTALQQIPTTDDKGQTLTALPLAAQPVVKVIQVAPSAILSSAIKSATIEFSLTDAEMAANNLKPEEVVLARFADGKWTELKTQSLGGGKFSAITPGFSVFVVTKAAAAIPAATATPAAESAAPTPTAAGAGPAATATPKPAAGGLPDTTMYGIVLVIIIVAVVVVLNSKRKK